MRPEPYYMYRAYRADDRLLYVGISLDLPQRLKAHASSSPWYEHMDRLAVEGPWSYDEVRKREYAAVIEERPLYNFDTPGRGLWRRSRDGIAQDAALRLHESRRYFFEDAWAIADHLASSLVAAPPRALEPFEYADGLHLEAEKARQRYDLDPESFIETAIETMVDHGWEPVLDHNARPRSVASER